MKKSSILSVFALSATVLFSACDSNEPDPKVEPTVTKESSVELNFDNRYGADDFALDKSYTTAGNDQIKFERVGYYISNVELVKADGSTYKEPNSYHLVWLEESVAKETFKIKNVPADNYTKIRFMIGIDSVQNAQVPGTGDLAPDSHMSWMWTTSYIFYAATGYYQDPAKTPAQQKFAYDIGHNGSMRQIELTLPGNTRIDNDHNPKVHIYADQKVAFGGPNVIDVKATPNIGGGPQDAAASKLVADNYATMFKIQDVQ